MLRYILEALLIQYMFSLLYDVDLLMLLGLFYLQGLLAFYGLPHPHALVQPSAGEPTSLPQGVQFEFQTLPVIETILLISVILVLCFG